MTETKTVQISRRGAGDPGGLATALKQAFNPGRDEWFHLGGRDGSIVYRLHQHKSEVMGDLGAELVKLAYRRANLAWPLLHEMSDRFLWSSLFRSEETGKNSRFNDRFARLIMPDSRNRPHVTDPGMWTHYVVHDYPLAPLPAIFRRINDNKKSVRRNIVISYVCHTSWPRWETVSDQVTDAKQKRDRVTKLTVLDKLVLGMLGADLLFFHTRTWANNFAEYVANRFKDQYKVCTSGDRFWIETQNDGSIRTIELITHAIGVDVAFWTQSASSGVLADLYVHMGHDFELPQDKKVLFSYGRLDYTKGVPNRWRAISPFLKGYPEPEEVLFLEIGAPTRGGLPGFLEEREACIDIHGQVNEEYPGSLLLVNRLVPQTVVAPFSRLSRVGLFSSIMDGCNLACKEWLICQDDADPGVLCLSRTAGAWEELGEIALELNPHDPEQMAQTFHAALAMPPEERQRRTARGKTILELNPVQDWAEHLRRAAEEKISRLRFATAR